MKVHISKLKINLETDLKPIYLISGDEPLQFNEACDEIRSFCKANGYEDREIIEAGTSFDWSSLINQANSLSLFSKKKFIDLRLPNGKIGKEGSKVIVDYCEDIPEDTIMLISMPKIEKAQQSTKWYKSIDKVGISLQIWPIDGTAMEGWIVNRLKKIGIQVEPEVSRIIIDKAEGNLLAANQEIEKLFLLYGKEKINVTKFKESITDNSKFNIFDLVDTTICGKVQRSIKILDGLRNEGLAPSIILWALHREISQISAISTDNALGSDIEKAMKKFKVWEKRKPIIRSAILKTKPTEWLKLLKYCYYIDASIKNADNQDPWVRLENLCIQICKPNEINKAIGV